MFLAAPSLARAVFFAPCTEAETASQEGAEHRPESKNDEA